MLIKNICGKTDLLRANSEYLWYKCSDINRITLSFIYILPCFPDFLLLKRIYTLYISYLLNTLSCLTLPFVTQSMLN